jgi:hypothetical protein
MSATNAQLQQHKCIITKHMEEKDLPEGEPSAKRHGVAQQGMHYHDRSTKAVVPKILDHHNSIRFSSVTPFKLPLF